MEGEIDDILPIGSLNGTENGYVRNETQRDEPKTVVESDIYREYASLCEPHESMLFSGVKPSFDRTATDKRGKVPTIVVESDCEKDLNLPISFGSGVRPSFTRIAANQCVQVLKWFDYVMEGLIYLTRKGLADDPHFIRRLEHSECGTQSIIISNLAVKSWLTRTAAKKCAEEPKTVVESDIYREYASLCEPHESMLFSGVKPSFDRTATDKRGKVPTIVVESDCEKDLNLPISFGSGVRPSFTRIAANQCVQVGDMNLGQSVPSQKKIIVRLSSEALIKATDGDEEILEEEAVCKLCFAKFRSNDIILKTCCGCLSVLVHEKCLDINWCKRNYLNTDNCNICGKKVQRLPVILISNVIPIKIGNSQWNWSSCFKR